MNHNVPYKEQEKYQEINHTKKLDYDKVSSPGRNCNGPTHPPGEYYIECILERKVHGKSISYLVKWRDYPLEDATWEPYEHVRDCKALDDFEATH